MFLVYFLTEKLSGKPIFSIIEVLAIIGTLLVIDFVMRFYSEKIKGKAEDHIEYKPFDYINDYELVEDLLSRRGMRAQVIMHTCDPPYGEKSSEPYMMYFRCNFQNTNGLIERGLVAMAMPHRALVKVMKGIWYIENKENDWSGAPKITKERTLRFYLPKPAYIEPIKTTPALPLSKEKESGDEEGAEE